MKRIKVSALLLVGLVSFFFFMVIQVPAAWVVSHVDSLQQPLKAYSARVSGSLWAGWALAKINNQDIRIDWRLAPWCLFMGRGCIHLEFKLAADPKKPKQVSFLHTSLVFPLAMGATDCMPIGWIKLKKAHGRLGPEVIHLLPRSVPKVTWVGDITINDLSFAMDFKKMKVTQALGDLNWVGSDLKYWLSGQPKSISLSKANLSLEAVNKEYQMRLNSGAVQSKQQQTLVSVNTHNQGAGLKLEVYQALGSMLGYLPRGKDPNRVLYGERLTLKPLICNLGLGGRG